MRTYATENPSASPTTSLDVTDIMRGLVEVQTTPGTSVILAVADHIQVVGVLILVRLPQIHHSGRCAALIDLLAVEKGRRREGVGRRLVEAALAQASHWDCYRCYLVCPEHNHVAGTFYRDMGFSLSGNYFEVYLG
jgi:GNAT superfamily N-acetyltransferase